MKKLIIGTLIGILLLSSSMTAFAESVVHVVTDVPGGETLGMIDVSLEGKQMGQICGKQSSFDEPTVRMDIENGLELTEYATYSYRDSAGYKLMDDAVITDFIADEEDAKYFIDCLKLDRGLIEKDNPAEVFLTSLTEEDYKKYDIIVYAKYSYTGREMFRAIHSFEENGDVINVKFYMVNPLTLIVDKYMNNIMYYGNMGANYNFVLIPEGKIQNKDVTVSVDEVVITDPEMTDMFYPVPDLSYYLDDEIPFVIDSEGLLITLSKTVTEEGKNAFLLILENTSGSRFIGNIKVDLSQINENLGELKWDIDGESISIEYEEFHLEHPEISFPKELMGKNTTATLLLECEDDQTVGIDDVECESDNDNSFDSYFVVRDEVNNRLFGKFGSAFSCFKIFDSTEEATKDLWFFGGGNIPSIENNEIIPWREYESLVGSVHIKDAGKINSHVLDSCEYLSEIYFYDKDTVIADDIYSNPNNNQLTIYGYYDSTAESYAIEKGFDFIAFDRSQEGIVQSNGDQKIVWKYDENKKELVISGKGIIGDYNYGGALIPWEPNLSKRTPWDDFAENVEKLIVEDGITRIGKYAFVDFTSLEEIRIADSVEEMNYFGENVFPDELSKEAVIYCGAGTEAEKYAFENKIKLHVDGVIVGDTNNDEAVNAEDALRILEMASKIRVSMYYQADYNKDFAVNAVDALEVLKFAAKI